MTHSEPPFRLVLVGYGRIAPKHLEAFRAAGAEFVACCNQSDEGRKAAQAEGRIPRTYPTIGEMLERERPDGVVCCASLDQIYSAGREILPFSIPTLLEKPPGTTLAEYEELVKLSRRHETPVMVGLNRRHYSVFRRAIDDAGGRDKITAVFVDWSEDPTHLFNRGLNEKQVERTIFGNSLHGLDLLTFLAGDVPRPAILARDLGEPFRWIMSLQGISATGALATFQSTWDSPGNWRVVFCTPGRRYIFAPLETCIVQETGRKEPRVIEPEPIDQQFKAGFRRQAEEFCRMIRLGVANEEHALSSARPAMQLAELLSAACLNQSNSSHRDTTGDDVPRTEV